MPPLSALWLPIILSAVIVFVASSILHMLLPYHHGDYKQLPEEDKTLSAIRAAGGIKRGLYVFPYTTHKEMNSPAMTEKYNQGPVGMLIAFPTGRPVMGKFLGLWFVYCLAISFFVAYLSAHTVALGTYYLAVFRVVGTAAFLSYGLGPLANGIWKSYPWSFVLKEVMDGLIYALLTAGTFGWLWPK